MSKKAFRRAKFDEPHYDDFSGKHLDGLGDRAQPAVAEPKPQDLVIATSRKSFDLDVAPAALPSFFAAFTGQLTDPSDAAAIREVGPRVDLPMFDATGIESTFVIQKYGTTLARFTVSMVSGNKKSTLRLKMDETVGIPSLHEQLVEKRIETALRLLEARSKSKAQPLVLADVKTTIRGMIKSLKKVRVSEASEQLGIPASQVKNLIFMLAGEDKIAGNFIDEDTFQVEVELDAVVSQIDSQFKEWGSKEKAKHGKIE